MLVMTLFGIAVLFVEEDAQFLAAVQVIVYAGAIVVLFLFVIMLLGVDRQERILAETFRGQRLVALVLGAARARRGAAARARPLDDRRPLGLGHRSPAESANVKALGESLFTTYLLPFEVTSALLVVAVVGAVVLARRHGRQPARAVRRSAQASEAS